MGTGQGPTPVPLSGHHPGTRTAQTDVTASQLLQDEQGWPAEAGEKQGSARGQQPFRGFREVDTPEPSQNRRLSQGSFTENKHQGSWAILTAGGTQGWDGGGPLPEGRDRDNGPFPRRAQRLPAAGLKEVWGQVAARGQGQDWKGERVRNPLARLCRPSAKPSVGHTDN